MSIKRIKINGELVGYQAYWRASTAYFAVKAYGAAVALREAKRREREMIAADPRGPGRRIQSNNRSKITGIRLVMQNHGGRDMPYVQASWPRGNTHYSVAKHGPIGATAKAIEARERGMGVAVPHSPRQAWLMIKGGCDPVGAVA